MTEEKSNAPIEVMVRLKTHIQYVDDEENIELITFGTLHHMPNATYIRYIEHVENNGKINTTVKYDGDEMLIIRSGAVKMRQLYKIGTETSGSYESIHGTLDLTTRTNKLEHTVHPETKEEIFHVSYNLFLQQENVGNYSLTLTVKEEKTR
ncbi:DUF1934 domain-containing protein [Pradoshia sp. D12]|uniref:DUF1934 domain-containing protein n=1 Tax=Bacillaceae TaxID=186817 RepID=UPI00080ACDE2|nr:MULTISPECIES: DUF1934 domain-containing protein [Bacillaceae]OCA81094.1 hypothetical protein A8L44_15500 [Bacillus sp. FJAT-27986]QFK73024.1 DUF1934 domain-containing protein [Pradoshia sp. D12]TPF72016.1 DUF1934 domain-containing protein [Bacillus sp. D12]